MRWFFILAFVLAGCGTVGVKQRIEPADVLMPPKMSAAPRVRSAAVVVHPTVFHLICEPTAMVECSSDMKNWKDFAEVSNMVITTDSPIEFFRVKPPVINLEWNPSPSEGVTGYRVYTGDQSGVYFQSDDAGMMTTLAVKIESPHPILYFACTAYDRSGQESEFSNEATVGMATALLQIKQ